MIRTVKKTLPLVVFILLSAGGGVLAIRYDKPAIMMIEVSAAMIIALLFYAVIRWDEAYHQQSREKQQLADVVDHAMDAIVVFTEAGRIIYANTAARSSCQFQPTPGGFISIEQFGLTPELKHVVLQHILRHQTWYGEIEHTRASGKKVIHLVNIFKLEEFLGHSPALVCIGRDVTQPKELEKRLQHSQKLAAVGELAAGVAHEINNPMAAINSQIGLARDLMQFSPSSDVHQDEILQCIDEAGRQVQRCSQIVNSLLRFSRRQEPELKQIDVGEAIEQALVFINSLGKMKNIQLTAESPPTIPFIKSDPQSISQILVNLIANAADAVNFNGPVKIQTRTPTPDSIAIDVIDSGCGISPDNLERVFEPFFTTKPTGQGTGLGLSISYGIAQSLGGDLTLQCPSSGGTVATLTLPVK